MRYNQHRKEKPLEKRALSDIATLYTGTTMVEPVVLPSDQYAFHQLQTKHIRDTQILWDELVPVILTANRRPESFVQKDDIVLIVRGTRFTAFRVDIEKEDVITDRNLMLIRLQDPAIAVYLTWYLNSSAGQHYIRSESYGTTSYTVKKASLERMPIPFPEREEERAILTRLVELVETQTRQMNEYLSMQQARLETLVDIGEVRRG